MTIQQGVFKKLSAKGGVYQKVCYQPKGVHMDGNLIEFPLKPMTKAAHQAFLPMYNYLLEGMYLMGCTNALGTNGMHLYMDLGLFGDNPRQAVATMLRFCFENYDWLVEFSGRPHIYSTNADFPSMLKDRWRNLSDAQFREAFLNTKNSFLEILDSPEASDTVFNIGINKKPNTLEVRWFATPESGMEILSIVSTMFALANLCSITPEDTTPTMKEFCTFIDKNKRKFYQAWTSLAHNTYTQDICIDIVRHVYED